MSYELMVALFILVAALIVLSVIIVIASCVVASVSDERMAKLTEVLENESEGLSETTEKAGHDDFKQID